LIERAEAEGLLHPGDTIVEASSGNTANAMSMVAAATGYRMVVVMPNGLSGNGPPSPRPSAPKSSPSEIFTSMLLLVMRGNSADNPASLHLGSSTRNGTSTRTESGSAPRSSHSCPSGSYQTRLSWALGTGGTLIGVGQAFRTVNPKVLIVAVEPNESCTIRCGEIGKHQIEGISDGFVPGIVNRHRALIDEVSSVDSEDAIAEMRRLARCHGFFVGPSSGAHLVAARKLRTDRPELAQIVTVFPDAGEKYIGNHFT
jgi:cysteine synthase A